MFSTYRQLAAIGATSLKTKAEMIKSGAIVLLAFAALSAPICAFSNTTLQGQRFTLPYTGFDYVNTPAIHGDWIAVRAADKVYLYKRQAGQWSYSQTLVEPPPPGGSQSGEFGASLAISDQAIFVGDPGYRPFYGNSTGGAVFVYTLQMGTWQLAQKIISYESYIGGYHFGASLADDGAHLYVGMYDYVNPISGVSTGEVEVFDISTIPASFVTQLLPTVPVVNSGFSYNLAAAEGTVAVGAFTQGFAGMGPGVGALYPFTRSGNDWTEESMLMSPTPHGGDQFALSLAVDGNRIIGASHIPDPVRQGPGVAFSYVDAGGGFSYEGTLSPPDSSLDDGFGEFLASENGLVVVGSPRSGIGGHVYGMRYSGGSWQTVGTFVVNDLPADSLFGRGLAIDGSTLAVEAPAEPGGTALYIFNNFPTDRIFAEGFDP